MNYRAGRSLFPAPFFIFSQSRARKASPFWKIDLVFNVISGSYLLVSKRI